MFKMALQYDSNKILTTKMIIRVLGFVQSHTQWYNIGSEEMPSRQYLCCADDGVCCNWSSLLASGVGFVPGLAVTGVSGLLNLVAVAVSRKCSVKAAKT